MLFSLTVLIALALILFFVGLFLWAVIATWRRRDGKPPVYSDAFLYVATTLASMVGGIVAVALSQPPVSSSMSGTDWVAVLTSTYAIIWVIVSLVALLTWVLKTEVTPTVIKNLATTFLGLAIPTVTAFFHQHPLREILKKP